MFRHICRGRRQEFEQATDTDLVGSQSVRQGRLSVFPYKSRVKTTAFKCRFQTDLKKTVYTCIVYCKVILSHSDLIELCFNPSYIQSLVQMISEEPYYHVCQSTVFNVILSIRQYFLTFSQYSTFTICFFFCQKFNLLMTRGKSS